MGWAFSPMTGVLKKSHVKTHVEEAVGQRKQRLEHCDHHVTRSRGCLQPPDAERGRKDRPLERAEGSQPCRLLDPRPLGENSFLLFEARCYRRPERLTRAGRQGQSSYLPDTPRKIRHV